MKIFMMMIGLVMASQAQAALTCGQNVEKGELIASVLIDGRIAYTISAGQDTSLQGAVLAACNSALKSASQCQSVYHEAKKGNDNKFSEGYDPSYAAYNAIENQLDKSWFKTNFKSWDACNAFTAMKKMKSAKASYQQAARDQAARDEQARIERMSQRERIEYYQNKGTLGPKF